MTYSLYLPKYQAFLYPHFSVQKVHIEYKMKNNNQLFWCWNRNIPWESGQYHSCWWPDRLRRQDISSYAIDYVG